MQGIDPCTGLARQICYLTLLHVRNPWSAALLAVSKAGDIPSWAKAWRMLEMFCRMNPYIRFPLRCAISAPESEPRLEYYHTCTCIAMLSFGLPLCSCLVLCACCFRHVHACCCIGLTVLGSRLHKTGSHPKDAKMTSQ